MTAKDIAERWLGSVHGNTPAREAKAKAKAAQNKPVPIPWADVLKECDIYRTAHPELDPPKDS